MLQELGGRGLYLNCHEKILIVCQKIKEGLDLIEFCHAKL